MGPASYAIGGNENAARLTGVPVARVKLQAYVISGSLPLCPPC
jgi:ribose transport system permease protein